MSVTQSLNAMKIISNEYYSQKYCLTQKEADEKGIEFLTLPSRSCVLEYKHLMAIAAERNCALDLINSDSLNSAFYDSTTRKNLKGEITTFSFKIGQQMHHLRPLSLARETRENIVFLFKTHLQRLATLTKCDVKLIWEQIGVISTDSVSKNLKIGEAVAKEIGSLHVPLQILCNAHFCDGADRTILNCIDKIEKSLNLKNYVIAIMPSLSSFLRSKTVTEAAILAMCSLVSNNGKKSSLCEEFDNTLSKNERKKKIHDFKERRFAAFGYSAAACIYHWKDLEDLLGMDYKYRYLIRKVI